MRQIHCITYASNRFLSRKSNFLQEASIFGMFDNVKVYSTEDLNSSFCEKFNSILSLPRGGGYWLWKIQIIKQHLQQINDNDILFYLDVGCTINTTETSLKTFSQYLDIIENNTFLRFQLEHLEELFTNNVMLNYFAKKYNFNIEKLAKSKQLMGTILGVKKNDKTVSFFNEAYTIIDEDPLLITDHYNENNKRSCFIDHRHDQSLLSLLYKCSNYTHAVIDHTYSIDWSQLTHIPFLTTRKTI